MFRLRNQDQRAFKLGNPILALGFLVLASLSHQSYAQNYPNRTVKMVVPLTPGSGADIAGTDIAGAGVGASTITGCSAIGIGISSSTIFTSVSVSVVSSI